MNAAELLIRKWRDEGVALNPGASVQELRVLETILGIELSEELERFYTAANGMSENVHDTHMVEFWSIDRIAREAAESNDPDIGFADVLISSWRFIFRPEATGLVVVSENVLPSSPMRVLGTFAQFLETYLRTPWELDIP